MKKGCKVETISFTSCCVKVYRKFTRGTAGSISIYGLVLFFVRLKDGSIILKWGSKQL